MRNLQEFVEKPKPLEAGDHIVQLFINERYDQFAVFSSGRIFKKRARGQSGAYDLWQEIDIIKEIKEDLKLK